MIYAVAAVAGIGVFLTVAGRRGTRLALRLETYLRPKRPAEPAPALESVAGLPCTPQQLVTRRIGAAVAGVVGGLLAAQGDLFVAGPSRSAPALAVLGGAAGVLLVNMHLSTWRQRRARHLRFELPVVSEALALQVLAGESVGTSIARLVESAKGVAAEELAAVMTATDEGLGLAEALLDAARATVEEQAARLYNLLAHAHVSGGRLAASLSELAVDYRAALARDLTAESGRRALATYGPVLGLMVPVTLIFLLYPTIEGLRSLAP